MRVGRVLTNETCNQNCGYCLTRRSRERPDFVAPPSVLARIRATVDQGAEEVVLCGGEPSLRKDLPVLVASAKRSGASRVVLETNAAVIDAAAASALARAGLDVARVKLAGWGAACDAITEDPGGFDATLRAMRELDRLGIDVQPLLPITARNATDVAELPGRLVEAGLRPALSLVRPTLDAPTPEAICPVGEMVAAVEALAGAARKVGLNLRLDPDAFVPPCVFPHPHRVAHLYTLTPGGAERPKHSRVEACGACEVRDRCPGVPDELRTAGATDRIRPIAEDRIRRRLSVIESVEAQIARELVTRETSRRVDGSAVPMHTVRVSFHCNQSCRFCFVSTHLPPPEEEAVRAAVEEAGRLGAVLALSGGEPTLNPKLAEYVRLGKASGVLEIELQTNAVRLTDPELVAELEAAGVDVAFVSLHGATAEVSDRVTGAPGTFDQTVLGLDELQKSGIRLRVNFVFCRNNHHEFPSMIRMVAERWPKAIQTVSFVAPSTDLVPRDVELVPRYGEVLPSMAEGMALAKSLGVTVSGFESMCGLPLCLVPDDVQQFVDLAELASGEDRGEFVKPPPCAECALGSKCWGLRTRYAELHGWDELRPVARQ